MVPVFWVSPEYGAPLADDNEGSLVCIVGVDVTDRGGGKLQGELPVPARQVIT